MKVEILPSRAKGTVNAPTSKSMAHRLLICAALAEGKSTLRGVTDCADVRATVDCLTKLGVKIEKCGDTYTVFGRNIKEVRPEGELFANESGSTLRFLIPIASLCGEEVTFSGAERLMERPLTVYEDIYKTHGYSFLRQDGKIKVKGPLPAGEYTVRGDISSQFITGLIYALSQAEGSSIIKVTPPFESRSYIEMTLAAANAFGVHAKFLDQFTIGIESGRYRPMDITVEGDYSGAAFIEALNLFSGEVNILGLREDSLQGDKVYKTHFDELKRGFAKIDISDCPDLGPILFAVAVACHGGEFTGTKRLKIKESDRAEAMKEELSKLGVTLEVREDSVTAHKSTLKAPSEPIKSHGDHRIVMSMATLLTLVGGEIEGASAVAKSYPEFFDDLLSLGIKVNIKDETK